MNPAAEAFETGPREARIAGFNLARAAAAGHSDSVRPPAAACEARYAEASVFRRTHPESDCRRLSHHSRIRRTTVAAISSVKKVPSSTKASWAIRSASSNRCQSTSRNTLSTATLNAAITQIPGSPSPQRADFRESLDLDPRAPVADSHIGNAISAMDAGAATKPCRNVFRQSEGVGFCDTDTAISEPPKSITRINSSLPIPGTRIPIAV